MMLLLLGGVAALTAFESCADAQGRGMPGAQRSSLP